MSPGRRSTGRRFMVARAAPVIMLVAPGPIEEVQARAESRLRILAKADAVWTMPCSLRGLVVGEPVSVLLQGLSHTGDVAMAENVETSFEKPMLYPVPLYVLLRQESNQGPRSG